MRILGMMTGTSCDGLDAVCVELSGGPKTPQWRILWSASAPYPANLRKKILAIQHPGKKSPIRELLEIDRELGTWYGKTAARLTSLNETKPQVIANHGQTVAHFPDQGSTLQLGDPSRIAQLTGISVVSHFREGDLASGGQGAPLLPLFHRLLAASLPESRSGVAIHNLGGISNLTYVPPNAAESVLAFDTGPSNIWIDEATTVVTHGRRKFDRNGELAKKGTADLAAVSKIVRLPYFRKTPPKSTGRDDFPFSLLRSRTRSRGNDLIATATRITVESIAQAYERHILGKGLPLQAIYFAGGGARNAHLMEQLSQRLSPVRVSRLAEAGIDLLTDQVLEPLGFAMFGYLSLRGERLGGAWTGAKRFGPPGWITPGENWPNVLAELR